MLDEFSQQQAAMPSGPVHTPFAMEHMRHELDHLAARPASARSGSPGWAAEFDPGEQARMEAAFNKPAGPMSPGFNPAEFSRFQAQQQNLSQQRSMTGSPASGMMGMQRPMGMGYMGGMGMGMGMGMNSGFAPGMYAQNQQMQQQPATASAKGKERMVELDDQNWEEQFAAMDTAGQDALDDQANAAMEAELNEMDRSVPFGLDEDQFRDFESVWNGIEAETAANRQLVDEAGELNFDQTPDLGEFPEWDGFDRVGLVRDPQLGDYLFEEENAYRAVPNPFEEGVRIMNEGGNLSLAALAFEAAVQKDPSHIDAWVQLGQAQAQNEKESPAIRALEQALKLDQQNLDAMMSLAVSYTNEGYDSTAYRTLERWLSTKYPDIIPSGDLTPDADLGFTDRHTLHEKVTNFFLEAAQRSPSGEQMDPDVQLGLGVLFYGAEEYDKAVDCFSAALGSTESGMSNQQNQIHILWNRLGATLANSGRSEEAIAAYEKALTIRPNFVRARYNLGVSCINIGCYPEAAQHLLGALTMHRVVAEQGLESARELVGDEMDSDTLARMLMQNESTNLYDTLRRVFNQMGRRDLSEMVTPGMDLSAFKSQFEF